MDLIGDFLSAIAYELGGGFWGWLMVVPAILAVGAAVIWIIKQIWELIRI